MAFFEETDGAPEKIGRILALAVIVAVFGGIGWMMARASGFI